MRSDSCKLQYIVHKLLLLPEKKKKKEVKEYTAQEAMILPFVVFWNCPLSPDPALAVTLIVCILSPKARAPTVSMEPWRK